VLSLLSFSHGYRRIHQFSPPLFSTSFFPMCCTLLTRLTQVPLPISLTFHRYPSWFVFSFLFFLIICLRVFPSLCVQSKGEAGNIVYLIANAPQLIHKNPNFLSFPPVFFFCHALLPPSLSLCLVLALFAPFYSLIETMMYDMALSFFVLSKERRGKKNNIRFMIQVRTKRKQRWM
jgi:hypothetical protein